MPALPELGVRLGLSRTFDFQHGVVEYTLKLSMWGRQRQEDICEFQDSWVYVVRFASNKETKPKPKPNIFEIFFSQTIQYFQRLNILDVLIFPVFYWSEFSSTS